MLKHGGYNNNYNNYTTNWYDIIALYINTLLLSVNQSIWFHTQRKVIEAEDTPLLALSAGFSELDQPCL